MKRPGSTRRPASRGKPPGRRRPPPAPRPLLFEPLEPRLLLSGDPIIGTAAADILNGTPDDELIQGLGGADVLTGFGGNDRLEGGQGDDTYKFADGWGIDTVVELDGEGIDTLDFGAVSGELTIAVAADGRITVSQGANSVTADHVEKLIGGTGHDLLDLSAVSSGLTITLKASGEVVVAGGASLSIFAIEDLTGGQGDDTVVFEKGALLEGVLDGGAGENTLAYSDPGAPDTSAAGFDASVRVILPGGGGADGRATAIDGFAIGGLKNFGAVVGGRGDDRVTGSDLPNTLVGGRGADTLTGLDANDSLVGGAGDDTLSGGAGDDFLRGDGAAATLPDSNDLLIGGAGDDTLVGGAGHDRYVFGPGWGRDTVIEATDDGRDTFDFGNVTVPLAVTIDASGVAVTTGGADPQTVSGGSIEVVIGGQGADTYTFGPTWANEISIEDSDPGAPTTVLDFSQVAAHLTILVAAGATPGGNTVTVLGGSFAVTARNVARVVGGAGDDVFVFETGGTIRDVDGGAGTDRLSYLTYDGAIDVDLAAATATGVLGSLASVESVRGGARGDTVLGADDVRQTFFGEGGDDHLEAGQHPLDTPGDTLEGGPGDDTLVGADGRDHLAGDAGNDTFRAGASADTLEGGAGNDRLEGEAGADVLTGGAGNDTLDGGAGDDTLAGGVGDDTYVFGPGWGADTVAPDAGGTDTLDFSAVADGLTHSISGGKLTSGTGAFARDPDREVSLDLDLSSIKSSSGTFAAGADTVTAVELDTIDRLVLGSGANTILFDGVRALEIDARGASSLTLDFQALANGLEFVFTTDAATGITTLTVTAPSLLAKGLDVFHLKTQPKITVIGVGANATVIGGRHENVFALKDGATFAGTVQGGTGKKLTTIPLIGTVIPDPSGLSVVNALDYSGDQFLRPKLVNLSSLVSSLQGATGFTGTIRDVHEVRYGPSILNAFFGTNASPSGLGSDTFTPGTSSVPLLGLGVPTPGIHVLVGQTGADTYEFNNLWGFAAVIEPPDLVIDGQAAPEFFDTLDFSGAIGDFRIEIDQVTTENLNFLSSLLPALDFELAIGTNFVTVTELGPSELLRTALGAIGVDTAFLDAYVPEGTSRLYALDIENIVTSKFGNTQIVMRNGAVLKGTVNASTPGGTVDLDYSGYFADGHTGAGVTVDAGAGANAVAQTPRELALPFTWGRATGILGHRLSGATDLLVQSLRLLGFTGPAEAISDFLQDFAVSGIRNVTGTPFADMLAGNFKDNVLTSLGGDDRIDGVGDSRLVVDPFGVGTGGVDTVSLAGIETPVTLHLGAGTATIFAADGTTPVATLELEDLENVVAGTGGGTFTGSSGDNTFHFADAFGSVTLDTGGGRDIIDVTAVPGSVTARALAPGQLEVTAGTGTIVATGDVEVKGRDGQVTFVPLDVPLSTNAVLLLDGTPGSETAELTQVELTAMVAAAVERWRAAGALPPSATDDELEGLVFEVADLAGAELARQDPATGAIRIDATAAGIGWFVDGTPDDDAEFDATLTATAGGDAEGKVDLLTVVMHELGHLLQLGHAASGPGLMGETLAAGERRLPPTAAEVAALVASDEATLSLGLGAFADWVAGLGPRLEALFTAQPIPFVDLSFAGLFGIDPTVGTRIFDSVAEDIRDQVQAVFDAAVGPVTSTELLAVPGIEAVASSNPKEYRATLELWTFADEVELDLASVSLAGFGLRSSEAFSLDLHATLDLDFLFGIDDAGTFYVRDPGVSAGLFLGHDADDDGQADPFDLEIGFGFVGVGIEGGTLELEAALRLGADGRLDYADLVGHTVSPADLRPALAADSHFLVDLPIGLTGVLAGLSGEGARLFARNGEVPAFASFAEFFGEVELEAINLDQVLSLRGVSLDALLAGLSQALDELAAPDGPLYDEIPLVDTSVAGLLGPGAADFVTTLKDAVDAARDGLANIQQLEAALNRELGLAFGLAPDAHLVDLDYQDSTLLLTLELERTFTQSIPFDLSLSDLIPALGELVDLSSDGTIDVLATGVIGLGVGLDLGDVLAPELFFTDDTRIAATLDITTSAPIDLAATVTLPVVGDVGFTVQDGTVAIHLLGRFGLAEDADGRHALGELAANLDARAEGSLAIDLPLFFPTPTLPMGGSTQDRNGDGIADNVLHVAAGFTLADGLGAFEVVAPDFAASFDLFAFLNDPANVLAGLEGMFDAVKLGLESRFAQMTLPLIDEELAAAAEFVDTQLRVPLLGAKVGGHYAAPGPGEQASLGYILEQGAAEGATTVDLIREALFVTLGDLLVVPDRDASGDLQFDALGRVQYRPVASADDIELVLSSSGIQFNVLIAGTIFEKAVPLSFALSAPGFGLSAEDADLNLLLTYAFGLGFGFDRTIGLYLDTSGVTESGAELSLDLSATLGGDAVFTGQLTFLQVQLEEMSGADAAAYGVAPDTDGASGLFASISLDLTDDGGDGRWDIGGEGLEVSANLTAFANVDLGAQVSIEGTGIALPEVRTVVHYDQTFLDVTLSSASGTSIDIGGSPSVVFENVTLDLGKALSGFVGPIAQELDKYIGPETEIRRIIDLLTTPIDLGITTLRLLDLAQLKLTPAQFASVETAVEAIKTFSDFIGLVAASEGESIEISFGDFTVGGSLLSSPTSPVQASDTQGSRRPDLDAATDGKAGSKEVVKKFGTEPGSIQFPILQDPSSVLGLLLGRRVDLFIYDLPDLVFEFAYRQSFPVFTGVNAIIGGAVSGRTDLSFGFDTTGINAWKDADFALGDIDKIFDGFYFGDWDSAGNEKPEVTLTAELRAGVSLGLSGLVEAGVEGGIIATVELDLADVPEPGTGVNTIPPVFDGRMYLDEIVQRVAQSPLCLFDIHGDLRAFLEAFLWVGLDVGFFEITLFEVRKRFVDAILAEFDHFCPPPVADVAELSGRQLEVRFIEDGEVEAGQVAEDYRIAMVERDFTDDGVDNPTDWIQVSGNGALEFFDPNDVDTILILGSPHDDRYVIDASIDKDIAIFGGAGNDRIDVRSAAAGRSRVVDGGLGNDDIKGGAGVDVLRGGDGDDTITGNGGADQLFGEGGHDFIVGGDAADTIEGGAGNDTIMAGGGHDVVRGGTGNDVIDGGEGDDLLYGVGPLATANAEAGNGRNRDVLLGRGGSDTIVGGDGDDQIVGGTGLLDVLSGGAGADSFLWTVGDSAQTIDGDLPGAPANAFEDSVRLLGYSRNELGEVLDAGQADLVDVSADGVDVSAAWSGTTLDLRDVRILDVDTGAGADTLRFGELRGTTITRVNATLGSARTIVEEARAPLDAQGNPVEQFDEDGNPIAEDVFRISQKANDLAADLIEILGEGGQDRFVLTDEAELDRENNAAVQYLRVAQQDGVTFEVREIGFAEDRLLIDAGDGDDTIDASGLEADLVDDLRLLGGAGADRLIGSRFTELLIGGAGADVVTGGEGVDVFVHADYPEAAREVDGTGSPVIDTLREQRDADFHLSDASLTIATETEVLAEHFERVELTGGDSANRFTLAGWTRNGLIDGGQGGDTYDFTVAQSGLGTNFLNVKDTGVSGIDEMVYRGSAGDDLIQLDTVYQRSQDPAQEFTSDRWTGYGQHGEGLLVVHFASDSSAYEKKDLEDTDALFDVTAVNLAGGDSFQVVNYSTVEIVTVFAGQGDDKIVSDDTAQTMNVYGNQGDDQFYVGSVLATENVLVEGREVTVVLEITRGASFGMSFYGGDDDDYFEVNHNAADISLFGDNGDDVFFIKALLTLDEDEEVTEVANKVATVSGVTGEGSEESQRDNDTRQVDVDSLVYVENANVRIDGGAGFDAVAIVGTVLADTFYVFTEVEDGQVVQRIFGAGVKLRELLNVERVLLLTGGGDDRVFVYGVDLGPVADLVINTGTGSDTVQFGGPERTIELAFPAQSRTEFASVNGYEEGDFREIAFDLGIQFIDALGRVVPFTAEEPAHTRLKTIEAAQSIDGIRSPVLVRDAEGLLDTVVFDNGAGPTALVLEDRELVRKTITTNEDLVIYPTAPGGATGLTDLIARLGSLPEAGRAVVVEQVNDYLEQQILFTDRYFDPQLVGRLLALVGAETETITIPEGTAYAVFQDALDAGGAIVTARAQLEAFLDGTGFAVEYVTAPHPDPSRTDLLFDIARIANADGAELAFEGQYREFVKDGEVFRDLIGVALITAAPVDVQVEAGYVTDVEVVDTEVWHSLHAEGQAPTIYFDDLEEIRIGLNATQASTITLDDDRFAGRITVEGGAANDTFRVVSLAGETFLRGGAGDDRFEVGTGTLDAIAKALFLIGEAGTDAIEVFAEDEADADVLLDQNTVTRTVQQDQLSKVTNALEFRNVSASEASLMAERLEVESVAYARLAADVSRADLEEIARQAAGDAGGTIEAALVAASAEFSAAIDALVGQQRGDYTTFVAGVLEEYSSARRAKEKAQADFDKIAAQAAAAQALIDLLDTLLSLIPGAPSVSQLVHNPSQASGFSSALRSTLGKLVDLVTRAKNFQQVVQTETKRQLGAEVLLDDNAITTGERASYFTNRGNGVTATVAAAAIIDGSAAVQSRLASIEQGLRDAAAPTAARLEATLTEVRRLGLAGADVATTVPLVLAALDDLVAHLESPSSGNADRWVRLERLELVKDVLVAAERARLEQVADLLAAIPGQAAFVAAADFLADAAPSFDGASELFDDPDFQRLVAAYRAARELAEDFIDYGTVRFEDFRSAVRNMDRFEVFKTYLDVPAGFDFAQFRADYQANVAQLNDNLALFADLALEAELEAKLASLHHDQDQVHAIANHNDAVRDFFLSLRQDAQTAFSEVDAALRSAYTVTISAFGFTFASIKLDHTRDVRYKNALGLRNDAISRDNLAAALRDEANAARAAVDADVAGLEQQLADLRARIGADRAALEALHDALESQYRFLRSLSPVAVQVLTETRGAQAAADFEDTSSLISELLTHEDAYTIGDEAVLPVHEERFLSQAEADAAYPELRLTAGSVIKRTRIVDGFKVLTLSGLNATGIHADYESVERLTLFLGETDDAVRVHDSLGQAGSRVVVEAGGGADAITLANEADSVDRYLGDVYVDAGHGSNRLLIDDHGDATGDTIVQDSAEGYVRLSGMAEGHILYRATGGDFALGLDVLTSSGSDDVTIRALDGGDHTELDLGAGDDHVTVEDFDVDAATSLTIYGRSGDDTVRAEAAPLGITAHGHAGDDALHGSEHADWLLGHEGADLVRANGGADWVEGHDGDDTLLGGAGDDTMLGGLGDDDLVGGSDLAGSADGDDVLDGGAGDDVLAGDNAIITRRGDAVTPLVRGLSGPVIYVGTTPQVTGMQASPTGAAARDITLLDHSTTADASTRGADYLAGGAGDDLLFGQMGDDVLQGDGSIDSFLLGMPVGASRASASGDDDGDDYVEGGAGDDTIFGNGGQDDLVGGSSGLFGLGTADQRPDGADLIYGGSGTHAARNDAGDESAEGHAADADVILGDNGEIYRLVGPGGAYLQFNYDDYSALLKVIPRAVALLDYAPDGSGLGAGDEVHGEAGDDSIHGATGDDILFGDGQDDDLFGESGHDWISGGAGDDGVLGDDGLILTSRNGLTEPLHGLLVPVVVNETISTPGGIQQATIHAPGALKKTADLTPFHLRADEDPVGDVDLADDILYGGLGNDSLHGGAGDDAMSGAEALPEFYAAPQNPGDVLGYGRVRAAEFAAYDEFDPWRKVEGFLLNFAARDASGQPIDDGADALFGDLGNDWLVGGTGRDHLYGGWGDDLLNADDDLDTNLGANDLPDGPNASYEDIAYGGAGRDVLVANTGGDRLIDWAGEFNSYIVPFGPFGGFTVSRALAPGLFEYLYDLSAADGADPTRAADTGGDPLRNGEPDGELGLVTQRDFAWRDQTGAPDDPQPGNIPGGSRDVLRAATFNDGSVGAFAPDSGVWAASGGTLQVSAESVGGDAVSVFHVDHVLPGYFEIQASVKPGKPTAGWKANAFVVFDYQGPTDFKFAGVDASTDKLQIGRRTAQGWIVDVQSNMQVKPDTFYNVLVAVNGTTVTLVVDNKAVLAHAFAPRVVDGMTYGLNWGMVGVGSESSRGAFDNIRVQRLPERITFTETEDFDDGLADRFTGPLGGSWTVEAGRYLASSLPATAPAISLVDLGLPGGLHPASVLQLEAILRTAGLAGLAFDAYGPEDFKFVALDAAGDRVLIGHHTSARGWAVDATAARVVDGAVDGTLEVSLKGTTVSVSLGGQVVLGHVYNAVVVDGGFGLLTAEAGTSFDAVTVRTDDPALGVPVAGLAATAMGPAADGLLAPEALASIVAEAKRRWAEALGLDAGQAVSLDTVQVELADLPGERLGETRGTTVRLDRDAAGHGWFVDPTPRDDGEFGPDGRAPAGSSAAHAVDLLTVVVHELGHALDFGHSGGHDGHAMDPVLSPGLRRLSLEPEDGARDEATVPARSSLPPVRGTAADLDVALGLARPATWPAGSVEPLVDWRPRVEAPRRPMPLASSGPLLPAFPDLLPATERSGGPVPDERGREPGDALDGALEIDLTVDTEPDVAHELD